MRATAAKRLSAGRTLLAVVAAAAMLGLGLPQGVRAAVSNWVVDDLVDGHDELAGDGFCDAAGAATCTLRAAIEEANASSAEDRITFSVTGTHLLDPALGGLTVSGGQNVTIEGNGMGPDRTVVSGSDAVRVFFFGYPGTFALRDLRIRDGRVTDANCCHGAGIFNRFGTLHLERVAVVDNVIDLTFGGATGAGVNSDGPLTMVDSEIAGNTITLGGHGAGLRASSLVRIIGSTIAGNSTAADPWAGAGGVYLQDWRDTPSEITNSTISDNHGGTMPWDTAGGLVSDQTLVITNTTIAGNTGTTANLSIRVQTWNSTVGANLTNTIVAGSGAVANCIVTGAPIVADHNIESGTSCGFGSGSGNQSSTDPLLGPLADNGGDTRTNALGDGSPAIDAGSATSCPATDQRGLSRPVDGDGNGSAACDMGAYEAVPPRNEPPVADAGPDTGGEEGAVIPLAGSGSDADGDRLTYAWSAGSAACIFADPAAASTSVTCADEGTHALTLTADDGASSDTDDVTVTVANAPPVVGSLAGPLDPVALGGAAPFSGSFSDPGSADVHAATWDWGDGSSSAGVVTETAGSGTVGGSHLYAAAGLYIVTLTVSDDDGGSASAQFSYVVVYDANGGSVAGRGTILSPAGAYSADPSVSGTASFSFASKYKHGAQVPTGTTSFAIESAGFSFESASYGWLVVSGGRVWYKGEGSVNGAAGYGFMLSAIDGKVSSGGGVDRFRIMIWSLATGVVIYDNQAGGADTADPTTALKSGRVMIRR